MRAGALQPAATSLGLLEVRGVWRKGERQRRVAAVDAFGLFLLSS
jgi:hypothetical protein